MHRRLVEVTIIMTLVLKSRKHTSVPSIFHNLLGMETVVNDGTETYMTHFSQYINGFMYAKTVPGLFYFTYYNQH